jgi:hypothetical protein
MVLAAVFLVFYFIKRNSILKKGKAKKPILWLILSGCSYLLSFGGLILIIVSYFMMYIPNFGDFNSVAWDGGEMIAGNGNGQFKVTGVGEGLDTVKGKTFHRIDFTLENLFDNPVTIQGFKVISEMDDKEVAAYSGPALPFVLKTNEKRDIGIQAEYSDRIRDHGKKENKDDYGLTGYLTVVTSEGKLPGIPLRFTDKP